MHMLCVQISMLSPYTIRAARLTRYLTQDPGVCHMQICRNKTGLLPVQTFKCLLHVGVPYKVKALRAVYV